MFRIGIGYDVHSLLEGRPLFLGGVNIPFDKGLDGHSDADVLIHSIIDSLLGAAGKGDIGALFPPTDKRFKNISSLLLLQQVNTMLKQEGWRVNNVDCVIVAQEPKMAGYISAMEKNIAKVLQVDAAVINVKATTTEGLGFAGHGKGIASYAVSMIKKSP